MEGLTTVRSPSGGERNRDSSDDDRVGSRNATGGADDHADRQGKGTAKGTIGSKGGEGRLQYHWTTERSRLKERQGYDLPDYFLVKSEIEPTKRCISQSSSRPTGPYANWLEMEEGGSHDEAPPWYIMKGKGGNTREPIPELETVRNVH